jgi:hypothetical protein
MAGMAEANTAVMKSPGTLDGVEHILVRVYFHLEVVEVRRFMILLARNA